ncbi:MAG TPA: Xaa-Pro peptidase family protein [Pseudolabrys sp.]|nr:Xaa-Pro peptidase family protein [Pseudolabrys sp.]
MVSPNERILTRISDAELERRWSAVRAVMRRDKIDALVMQNSSDWIGGYVRWFTDLPATNGYPRTVIFHADSPMTVIEMGPAGRRAKFDNDPLHRGVGEMLCAPSFSSIVYTQGYDAELAVEALKRRGYKTIGFVGKGALPHALVDALEQSLGGTTFVDATDAVDRIKAIKSEEELALIRRCAEMQDAIFAAVLKAIKPGLRDIDVTALAQQEALRLGSEQGIFLGGSSPLGIRSSFVPRFMQGRTLHAGDHLSLLIEVNGPGGFYTEIARTLVLGRASNELRDGFEAVREAQDYTLKLMKPGTACRDIHAAHNDHMKKRGLPPELRLYAHGQGYDMVERPLIRSDETMTIEPGMNLAVHPGYETESLFAVICDNYVIGADGPGECLHRTPKQLFEV